MPRKMATSHAPSTMTDNPLLNPRSPIQQLQKFAPLAALILLIVGTALFEHFFKHSNTFISPVNVLNILRQNSMVDIVALGMTFVIILGGIILATVLLQRGRK